MSRVEKKAQGATTFLASQKKQLEAAFKAIGLNFSEGARIHLLDWLNKGAKPTREMKAAAKEKASKQTVAKKSQSRKPASKLAKPTRKFPRTKLKDVKVGSLPRGRRHRTQANGQDGKAIPSAVVESVVAKSTRRRGRPRKSV